MLDISISSGSFSFFCWHFSMNIYALKQACSRTLPDTLQTFCELLSTVSSHPWDYYHYSVLYHSIAKLNEAVFFISSTISAVSLFVCVSVLHLYYINPSVIASITLSSCYLSTAPFAHESHYLNTVIVGSWWTCFKVNMKSTVFCLLWKYTSHKVWCLSW